MKKSLKCIQTNNEHNRAHKLHNNQLDVISNFFYVQIKTFKSLFKFNGFKQVQKKFNKRFAIDSNQEIFNQVAEKQSVF